MNIYPIQESELRSISMFNTMAMFFYSIGTGLLSFGFGLYANGAMQESLTPTGTILKEIVAPICWAVSVCIYGLAIWSTKTKKSELGRILEESKTK